MAIRKLGNNEETPSTLIIGLKNKYQNPKEQSQYKVTVGKKVRLESSALKGYIYSQTIQDI